MNYPFNTGDLLCCGQCAANYLDANAKVPWDDLRSAHPALPRRHSGVRRLLLRACPGDRHWLPTDRYIIGEIMYGGHVVEDWDRRLTTAYLQTLFQEGLLEGQQLFPQFEFRAPQTNMNHRQVFLQ